MKYLLATKSGGIFGPIAIVLGFVINYLYIGLDKMGIGNVALAITIFTVIINIAMIPITMKQQKSTMVSALMNPEITKVRAKYSNKKDEASIRKMNAEMRMVYDKYGYSTAGGCIQLIVMMLILFALYQVIYRMPAYVDPLKDMYSKIAVAIQDAPGAGKICDGLINTLNLRGGVDVNNANTIIDMLSAVKSTQWAQVLEAFKGTPAVLEVINSTLPEISSANSVFGIMYVANTPTTTGMFPGILIPIIAAGTQFINTRVTQSISSSNGQQMGGTLKTMNMVMPVISFFLCFTLQIGIGIYWIAGSVVRTVITVLINKRLQKKGIKKIIEENRAKARRKAEKRGEDTSRFDRYARESTKSIDTPVAKEKSISDIAGASLKKGGGKNKNYVNKAKADDTRVIDEVENNITTDENGKVIKKNKHNIDTAGGKSISEIANMLKRKD